MTRVEEIKCASKDYVNYLLDKQEYHNEDYTEDDIRQAFENGAMFADRNPDLSSLWHDASEEPKKGEDIIALDIDGISVSGIYKDYNGNGIYRYHCFLCEWDAVVKWAYIIDLLPKGGGK